MNTQNNLLQNPWLQPGTCVAIILAFLLPFCNFKCGGVKIASVQGIDLVIGGQPEVSNSLGELADKKDLKETGEKSKVNVFIIIALAAAAGGAAMHFIAAAQKQKILLGIAALGLLALLIFAFTKNGFFELSKGGRGPGGDMDIGRVIKIELGIGYWICAAGFAFLGWLSWSALQREGGHFNEQGANKPAPEG